LSPEEPSSSGLWRALKIALAIVLIPLGVVGLFVPVLQGVLFLLVAMALLSSEVPWVRRYQDKLRARHPELWRRVDATKGRVTAWLHARFGGGGKGPNEAGRADR